jgi:hypothetical protein
VIVASLVLILVAVVLLVLGLADGSSTLLISSIAASLLAAVALVVGARQDTAVDADAYDDGRDEDVRGELAEPVIAAQREGRSVGVQHAATRGGGRTPPGWGSQPGGTGYGDAPVAVAEPTVTLPTQAPYDPAETYGGPRRTEWEAPAAAGAGTPAGPVDTDDEFDDEDPPDEPPPQAVSAAETARVARLSTDVLVIDGRPRYHLPGCVHLLGRESEPLPASEAVELGFTPCSLCEPASALLTDPRRG